MLAREFSRLLGPAAKSEEIEKTAASCGSHVDDHDNAGDHNEKSDESDDQDSSLDDQIADMLVEVDTNPTSLAEDSLDDDIKSFSSSNSFTEKQTAILDGLTKISNSLRGKSEGFAADVVDATMISLVDDFKKEANEKNSINSELSKIASELSAGNNNFASDLVLATLKRIN